MIPTINVGDSIVVNKYAYVSDEIKRFDIVVLNAPKQIVEERLNGESAVFVERIIGLPSEKIEIKNNVVFINDKPIEESFDKIVGENDFKKDFSAFVIPDNEYFVMGDNRPNSEDSRYWKQATINKKDILGEILEIIPKDE